MYCTDKHKLHLIIYKMVQHLQDGMAFKPPFCSNMPGAYVGAGVSSVSGNPPRSRVTNYSNMCVVTILRP